MYLEEVCRYIDFRLHNLAFEAIQEKRDYFNVISPFSRIYLITNGVGTLQIFNQEIELERGKMYLVPSYTFCNYHFSEGLQHYYIHFSNILDNGLKIFDLFSVKNSIKYSEFDFFLIKQLLSLHPNKALPTSVPEVYQTKPWLSLKTKYNSASQYLQTKGILAQLLARFLRDEKLEVDQNVDKAILLNPVFRFIQANLSLTISVQELADMVCLSRDHFSRVFKSSTGFPPGDYILNKRIEMAQFLLLTTGLSHSDICEKVGFSNISYFSRIFKKHTGIAPAKFRLSPI